MSQIDYLDMPAFLRRSAESEDDVYEVAPELATDAVGLDDAQRQRAARLVLNALLEILALVGSDEALTGLLMAQIAEPDRPLVEQFLANWPCSLMTRDEALTLLIDLRDIYAEETLTDDQEASFSRFEHELKRG